MHGGAPRRRIPTTCSRPVPSSTGRAGEEDGRPEVDRVYMGPRFRIE